ncbi:MAG: type II secretion system F family protein [Gammaproteobacteria bacterium]|nr:type II secretion system F family protein [Gammaproteobacteria bacterium]
MALFEYKARGPRGDAILGNMEAAHADAVAARLIEGGLTPVDITAARETRSLSNDLNSYFPQPVQLTDLIQFSRQMYSLTRAGVPILGALAGLTSTTTNRTLASTLADIRQMLEGGHDLASALNQHPKVFSPFYIAMIRVGETSGKLQDIFQQLAYYLEREKSTREQIKKALRYPAFVLFVLAVAMVLINIIVIPAFSDFFKSFNATLPLPTRILMGISDFMMNYWPWLLGALAALIFGAIQYVRTEEGRYRWDKLKLRLPLAGPVIYRASLARFTRLFAMAQRAGVPLITSLTVVARALDNRYVEERVLTLRTGIERGESIARTAASAGIFDALSLQMLAVGEEAGTLDDLLLEVAVYYDQEVEYSINKLSSAIEPILTFVVAGMVLMLAMGIFLPLWDIGSAALHGRG